MLDHNQIQRSTVTLVFDKGTAALDNTLLLKEAGVGWISALPWNQSPPELRERAVENLPLCSSDQPGVHAFAERAIVHGQEYLCVLKYSSSFASEQLPQHHDQSYQSASVPATAVDGSGQTEMPFKRSPDPQQNSTWAIVIAIPGRSHSVETGFAKWTMALTVRF